MFIEVVVFILTDDDSCTLVEVLKVSKDEECNSEAI